MRTIPPTGSTNAVSPTAWTDSGPLVDIAVHGSILNTVNYRSSGSGTRPSRSGEGSGSPPR